MLLAPLAASATAEAPLNFQDPKPQRYELSARASQIDPRARPHPEIDFVFEKGGKPADVENASVDTRVKPQGKLVIWLMSYSAPLFERVRDEAIAQQNRDDGSKAQRNRLVGFHQPIVVNRSGDGAEVNQPVQQLPSFAAQAANHSARRSRR